MQIVEDNINLVGHALKKYFNNGNGYEGFDQDDLFQIGCIGLMKASKKFDEKLGYSFSTYAMKWITGEIYTELNTKSTIIRYPRNIKDICRKINKENKEYNLEQIMEEYKLSKDQAYTVLDCLMNFNSLSLDAPIGDGDSTLIDTIESSYIINSEAFEELTERLSILTEKERVVILEALVYNNQQHIANKIGLSQVTVGRYIRNSIKKINESFGAANLIGGA